MTITAKLYGKLFLAAFNKEIDILDDTINVALFTSSYTPDQDVDDYYNDIVANEISGTGYTANGATLANDVLTYTAGTNVIMYDADDVAWSSSTITFRTAVVYDRTPGTDATRPLIMYEQSSADISTTSGTLTIQWNAAGLFTITVA